MENLGISSFKFIWQIINFLVLFLVLAKFLLPRVLKMLEERKSKIEEGLAVAEQAKKELASIEEIKAQEIGKARQESLELIKQAKADAETVRKQIVTKAEGEAHAIATKAQEDIKNKEKNALRNITKDAIDLSIIAAENILKEKVGSVDQNALIQRSLQEFDKAYETH
ncbi:MAG: F0F1 ATP synthase subunit B [bacterium]